jgi:hypothetical protein
LSEEFGSISEEFPRVTESSREFESSRERKDAWTINNETGGDGLEGDSQLSRISEAEAREGDMGGERSCTSNDACASAVVDHFRIHILTAANQRASRRSEKQEGLGNGEH